jgi:hypothetical protein
LLLRALCRLASTSTRTLHGRGAGRRLLPGPCGLPGPTPARLRLLLLRLLHALLLPLLLPVQLL